MLRRPVFTNVSPSLRRLLNDANLLSSTMALFTETSLPSMFATTLNSLLPDSITISFVEFVRTISSPFSAVKTNPSFVSSSPEKIVLLIFSIEPMAPKVCASELILMSSSISAKNELMSS